MFSEIKFPTQVFSYEFRGNFFERFLLLETRERLLLYLKKEVQISKVVLIKLINFIISAALPLLILKCIRY